MSIGGIFNSIKYSDTSIKESSSVSSQNPVNNLDVKMGSQITGKVVSSDKGSVTLDVNGVTVNAKLDGNVNLKSGDIVTFDVKGGNANQITLTPLYTNTATTSTAIKALSYANLPITEASIQMADSMINNNMKIDSGSLSSMFRAVTSFSDTNPSTIVDMKNMGITINQSNIESFEAFKNYESQITTGMNDIMNSIPDAFKELINNGNDNQFTNFALDLINTFTEEASTSVNVQEAISVESGLAESAILLNDESGDVINENVINGDAINAGALNGEALNGEILNGESLKALNVLTNEESVSVINSENVAGERNSLVNGEAIELSNSLTSEKTTDIINASPNEKTIMQESSDGWKTLTTFEKSNMIDALKSAGLSSKEASFLISDNANSKDFLNATKSLLENGNLSDKFKDMIASDKFGNILKTQMQEQWLLNPKDVSQKETVENLYRRLNEQVKTLTESLSNNAIENTTFAQNLSDMNNNLDFMNQMNNMYQYIQIPLKMAGSEATGDLFVYTDKKSLARNDGNVSALLHLDMDHLGPLDVYTSITPGNNVYTKFTLSDDLVLDFIEANMHILNERLENRGYNMKYETLLRNDTTQSNSTITEESTRIMKYSFDMKA